MVSSLYSSISPCVILLYANKRKQTVLVCFGMLVSPIRPHSKRWSLSEKEGRNKPVVSLSEEYDCKINKPILYSCICILEVLIDNWFRIRPEIIIPKIPFKPMDYHIIYFFFILVQPMITTFEKNKSKGMFRFI